MSITCHKTTAARTYLVTNLSLCDNLDLMWRALGDGYLQTLVVHHCTLIVAVVVQEPRPEVTLYQIWLGGGGISNHNQDNKSINLWYLGKCTKFRLRQGWNIEAALRLSISQISKVMCYIIIASFHMTHSQSPWTRSSWEVPNAQKCWRTFNKTHILNYGMLSAQLEAYFSKSLKKLTLKMWVLSSLYPFPVFTALVASSGVENSRKK